MGVLWEGVCLNLCVYEGREREREKLKECGKMSVVEGGVVFSQERDGDSAVEMQMDKSNYLFRNIVSNVVYSFFLEI